jgi:hypothetical protein
LPLTFQPSKRSPATAGEHIGRADLVLCVFVHFDPRFGLFGEVEDLYEDWCTDF